MLISVYSVYFVVKLSALTASLRLCVRCIYAR